MRIFPVLLAFLFLAGCAAQKSLPSKPPSGKAPAVRGTRPYRVNGKTYYPLSSAEGYVEEGVASWYGPGFHGRKTASGEPYNMYAFTAAHKILPFGTHVLVTNLENGRRTIVRINDRGPFVKGRIIDLSYAAARAIGMVEKGTARVRIEALAEGRVQGDRLVLRHPDFRRGRFYVQVGSFSRYANAFRLRERLARRFSQVVIEPFDRGDRTFYRVQVFASTDLSSARAFLERLSREFPEAFLVAR